MVTIVEIGTWWEIKPRIKEFNALLAQLIDEVAAAERERCARLVMDRAAKWSAAAKDGAHGDCAESLADECEDIVAAIRAAPTAGQE